MPPMHLSPELPDILINWYHANARDLPWRRTNDPYKIWVSEIMLQQTRVSTVIPYYERFVAALPDIQSLADAPEDLILKLWQGLGYYSRVRNMQKTAQIICAQHHGQLPPDENALRSLPGIGTYTAAAIASEAFNLPAPAVDGNVIRILSRILAWDGNAAAPATKKHFSTMLSEIFPSTECGIFTQSLMELGAVVCVPNGDPNCDVCPVSYLCLAYQRGETEVYPIKPEKKLRRELDRTVFLLIHKNRLAINRRSSSGLLANLWELPGSDEALDEEQAVQFLTSLGIKVNTVIPMPSAHHIFTHVTWRMRVFQADCANAPDFFTWVSPPDLKTTYALPSAFQKLLPPEWR